MRCAQNIFDRISGEKSMTKKWLYSVAVGVLLMAGEALGITVHDVLSNGFWSAEQRGTHEYLDEHAFGKGMTWIAGGETEDNPRGYG